MGTNFDEKHHFVPICPHQCAADGLRQGETLALTGKCMYDCTYFGTGLVLALLVVRKTAGKLLGRLGRSSKARTHRALLFVLVSACGQMSAQALCSGTSTLTANAGTISDGSGSSN